LIFLFKIAHNHITLIAKGAAVDVATRVLARQFLVGAVQDGLAPLAQGKERRIGERA
jgi:hypothetical protein